MSERIFEHTAQENSGHEYSEEMLMAYCDGELPAPEAPAVAQQLSACAGCRRVVDEFGALSGRLVTWQVEEPSPRLAHEVGKALEAAVAPAASAETPARATEKLASWFAGWLGRPPRWALASGTAVLLVAIGVKVIMPVVDRVATFSQTAALPGEVDALRDSRDETRRRENESSRMTPSSAIVPAPQTKELPPEMAASGLGESSDVNLSQPMIIKNASLVIVSREFDNARARVETLVARHGGYLANQQMAGTQGQVRQMNAVLRVPVAKFDAALAELRKVGRVDADSVWTEDVTGQHADLAARISSSKTMEQRLIEILRQRPGKLSDVLEVEQELARVRAEIERMEAELRGLSNRVAFANITLSLMEERATALNVTAPSAGTRLWNALAGGVREAGDSVINLIAYLLRRGPVLLLWLLILALPARALWRKLRRIFFARVAA